MLIISIINEATGSVKKCLKKFKIQFIYNKTYIISCCEINLNLHFEQYSTIHHLHRCYGGAAL